MGGDNNEWRKKLDIDPSELIYPLKLEWVSYHAVALVFRKKIKIVCCGTTESVFDIKEGGLRTHSLMTKSEIDGLRVIRIFDKDEQSCKPRASPQGSIIRRHPTSYSNVMGTFTDKAGYILYEGYLAFKDKKPIQEQDIRQSKVELAEGVTDLVKCGCFELDKVGLRSDPRKDRKTS